MNKEELIEKAKKILEETPVNAGYLSCSGHIGCNECPCQIEKGNGYCNGNDSYEWLENWIKENEDVGKEEKPAPKKRGPKPKPNKRERAEANIKAQRETLDLSEQRTFNCRGGEGEMTLLASYCYSDGYIYHNEPHNPQDALRVAKWVIDLEGK